jgi:hypothetical protein
MKKLFLFFLLCIVIGAAHAQDALPGDRLVTFAEAFAHCTHTFSYWFWIVFPLVFGSAAVWFIHKEGVKNNFDVDNIIKIVAILVIGFVIVHLFATPCDLAQNTYESWAQQGKWVGY